MLIFTLTQFFFIFTQPIEIFTHPSAKGPQELLQITTTWVMTTSENTRGSTRKSTRHTRAHFTLRSGLTSLGRAYAVFGVCLHLCCQCSGANVGLDFACNFSPVCCQCSGVSVGLYLHFFPCLPQWLPLNLGQASSSSWFPSSSSSSSSSISISSSSSSSSSSS